MRLKRIPFCLIIVTWIVSICFLLTGCPNEPSSDYIGMFEKSLDNRYGVKFAKTDLPITNLSYRSNDGTEKTVSLRLDGYDSKKNIGFKAVTINDIDQWKKERLKGNMNFPDLNDIDLIKQAASRYNFPIIIICVYNYQIDRDWNRIIDNQLQLENDISTVFNTPEFKQWAENGLYSGKWIKEGLEESCLTYNIHFAHSNLPVIDVDYSNNKTAEFQLDGYDNKKQIGYKFVTAENEQNWGKLRTEGDLKVPDLNDSDLIKQAALEYRFPVFFIYYPEYWKFSIADIFNRELSDPLEMNDKIKQWLKEHN